MTAVHVCQQVGVADTRQKIVKFGALHIGQTLKKIIPVVNNSAAPLTFNVVLNPVTPALQESGVLRLLPSEQPITLQAKGGMAKVEVMLAPKTRVSQFTEEVINSRALLTNINKINKESLLPVVLLPITAAAC